MSAIDTNGEAYAPIIEARRSWLAAREAYEACVGRCAAEREATERAERRWRHVTREMRPGADPWR